MPWHVQSEHPSCPAAKPFGVVKGHTGADGALEGCHPTRESANKQLAALYASEDAMTKGRAAPSNVHTGGDVANEADITFLHNIEVSLTGAVEHATDHIGSGAHTEVMALAQDVAATGGTQLAKAGSLKARLTDSGGGATSYKGAGKGPGQAPGQQMNSQPVGGQLRTAKKPYGDVTYADPGYQDDGKARYPIDTAEHVKAAWSYINQADNAKAYSPSQLASIKARIKSAAKKFGISIADTEGKNSAAMEPETRSVPFELGESRDGQTFEGYAAVFNSPTRINSRFEGEFDEVILPGAFKRSLSAKTPVLMFDHGQHPLVGSMPLGVITRAEEDANGLHISARLTDNWLIQPVRDAVRDGAVDGMSFRFSVGKKGESWQTRSGDVQLRTIHDFDAVPELGPVVFPAYAPTTASVRSQLEHIEATYAERLAEFAARTQDLTGRTARGADGGESSSDGPSSGRRADLTPRDLARVVDMRRLDVRRLRSS